MSVEMRAEITVTAIDISNNPQYMDHETVYRIHNVDKNIIAFAGLHNTALGPGLGGIRYKSYANEEEAIKDVLRLSEAMTWKNAAGGLKHGGGKSVIMAIDGEPKPTKDALITMAEGLNIINKEQPTYFGAEDMNISEECLNFMARHTPWLKGATSSDPAIVGGAPSPVTAMGVFECMKVAAKHTLGQDSLKGLKISMQGLGAVGRALAEHAYNDGAEIIACDTVDAPFKMLEDKGIKITRVGLDEIYDIKADIFAPNAIGGTLHAETIERLAKASVKIVCGAANNQQRDQKTNTESKILHDKGILYCPDYIVNAAGVIWVSKVGEDKAQSIAEIKEGVPRRFAEVLEIAAAKPDKHLGEIASAYSRKRVARAEEMRDNASQSADTQIHETV